MNFTKYVNLKQGTKSTVRFSNGNTLPLVQRPFGMAAFAPQTNNTRGNWFYHPEDKSFEGIRLTHQPSPWMGDYGHMVFMPQSGEAFVTEASRWSGFDLGKEVLSPYYLHYFLPRYQAGIELVPTERGAAIRLTFERQEVHRFALFLFEGKCRIEYDEKNNQIIGCTASVTDGAPEDFKEYFVFRFDKKVRGAETLITGINGERQQGVFTEENGAGMNVVFEEEAAFETVNVSFAISFISQQQAITNLEKELLGRTFALQKRQAKQIWEEYLSRICIDAEDNIKKTFYSCLYRTFLFPRKFYEVEADGTYIHCSMMDAKKKIGKLYTDSGFWDTFRTLYPLYSLIAPKEFAEIVEGYLEFYKDTGWMPKWLSPGERGTMPGTLIDAVIAEAAEKNILTKEQMEFALEGLLHHAEDTGEHLPYGRHGLEEYNRYGYIPADLYEESVNHTLDYVYGDFCIGQVAAKLGNQELAQKYHEKAKNYKLLYDAATGFMHGRNSDGSLTKDFNPNKWGGEYCEGSAWQNSFAVYHDIEGLIELMGGRKQFLEKLDKLFEDKVEYNVGSYQKEIHEMTEMAAASYGQCAISNQPSFHIPYLYFQAGERNKGRFWLRKILTEAFSYTEEGYPGDEDNGSMAAWYVLGAIGLYPTCPGKSTYILGTPLVECAEIALDQGKSIVIKGCEQNAFDITINGIVQIEAEVEHETLIRGAVLEFKPLNR